MNFNSLKYLFLEGLKNLLNNIFMALASIGVLTSCILIVGFSVLFKENVKKVLGFMGQQSIVSIYFKDETSQEQMQELQNILKTNENVKSLEFISKEKALEIFKEKFKDKNSTEMLNKNNTLPASFKVYIKNVEKIKDILSLTEEEKFAKIIEKVSAPTKFSDTLKAFNKTSKLFGTVLIITLILASLLIISNTIRAAVFSRRREIVIMKQVGATDSFVRFPFLIEGAAIGIISAIIAFVLTTIIYKAIYLMLTKIPSPFLSAMFSSMIEFKNVSIKFAICYFISGIATGSIGSLISLRKYLKF